MARLPLASLTLAPDFEAAGEPRGETFLIRPSIFSIVTVRSFQWAAGGPLGGRLALNGETRLPHAEKSSSEKWSVGISFGLGSIGSGAGRLVLVEVRSHPDHLPTLKLAAPSTTARTASSSPAPTITCATRCAAISRTTRARQAPSREERRRHTRDGSHGAPSTRVREHSSGNW